MSLGTGMITDIFLGEIISSGVGRFLRVATRRSYPPMGTSPPPQK